MENAGTAAGFVFVVLPETAGDSFRQLSDKSNTEGRALGSSLASWYL
jgi:hypothetical protein